MSKAVSLEKVEEIILKHGGRQVSKKDLVNIKKKKKTVIDKFGHALK